MDTEHDEVDNKQALFEKMPYLRFEDWGLYKTDEGGFVWRKSVQG